MAEGNDLSKISLQNETFGNNDHQQDIAEGDAEGVEDRGEKCSSADQKHVTGDSMGCLDGTAENHSIESPITDKIHECKYGISDVSDTWPASINDEVVGDNLDATDEKNGKGEMTLKTLPMVQIDKQLKRNL